MFTSLDLDETEEAVKGSAGQLYGWYIYNDGASEVYVKLYNATTGSVTVGSTAADLTIRSPGGLGGQRLQRERDRLLDRDYRCGDDRRRDRRRRRARGESGGRQLLL